MPEAPDLALRLARIRALIEQLDADPPSEGVLRETAARLRREAEALIASMNPSPKSDTEPT